MHSGQSELVQPVDLAFSFETKRYLLLRNLISVKVAEALHAYVRKQARSGRMYYDEQVNSSPSAYADYNTEKLLTTLQPILEQITGLSLFPTYSYYRLYGHGAELKRHCDRPACEISLSINLGQDPPTPWPLWVRYSGESYGAELLPGDALLYRGIECEHWRDPFPGNQAAQVFLHYVDANGPHALWKYDKRPRLNNIASKTSTAS
jgi:hypothetical protein